MTKLIVTGALAFLAVSAWAQPSFAQGASFAQGDGMIRKAVNTASQLGKANLPGAAGFHKIADKVKPPKPGKPGKHGAPLPLAGGLPALALMGVAVAWASRRRGTTSPPGGDVTGA